MPIVPSLPSTDVPVVSAMHLRRRGGELLDRVALRGEKFLIERAGAAKAVLVPLSEYNEMQRVKDAARERLFALINKTQKRLAARDPEEIEAIINEAIEATRRSKL